VRRSWPLQAGPGMEFGDITTAGHGQSSQTHVIMPPNLKAVGSSQLQRVRIVIRGAVQGVGFRPFIYRLADEMDLKGWVINNTQGVFIEAEATPEVLQQFLLRIEREKPAISFIQSFEHSYADPVPYDKFEIRESTDGAKTALILPDIATCDECQREIFDPTNRRYRYPFTNCTNCGPRFTIIEALPYDRPRTSMRIFEMCAECLEEYHNPRDRRFHAQPNACPKCGPHLELWAETGAVKSRGDDALLRAAAAIRDGLVVAVKGLGGFHLMVDAANEAAVIRLRQRKRREEKPFALMFPSLQGIVDYAVVDAMEERLLRSPEAPIVLLRRGKRDDLAASIAPGNPYLGVMLPYTPLHHLLMRELGIPVVATSGNVSDEPICIHEQEAILRLQGIGDLFLVHNRPIVRHVDDSVVRVMAGRELVLRRARGFAPLPVLVDRAAPDMIAVGAHQKNAVAATVGNQVFISQHIGDLETVPAYGAFEQVLADFTNLYELQTKIIACDVHPEYFSTQYARKQSDVDVVAVQHHYAHALSCMAENQVSAPALGISWDGSGYGPDETVWGGEFLRVTEAGFERVAHLRTFRLPGGEKAVKEPRRVALSILHETFGDDLNGCGDLAVLQAFTAEERRLLDEMLERGVRSPRTSSAGRLFDAVASIIGLRQICRFEGQAAMELEFLTHQIETEAGYPFELNHGADGRGIDWAQMVQAIIRDVHDEVSQCLIAAKFHNALVEMMVQVAQSCGEEKVALSGGCFQNRYLTERAIKRLREAGFRPYWHQRVPPNDGGIALGQVAAVSRMKSNSKMEEGAASCALQFQERS
jgi:hydrogenase maturation protein HypF